MYHDSGDGQFGSTKTLLEALTASAYPELRCVAAIALASHQAGHFPESDYVFSPAEIDISVHYALEDRNFKQLQNILNAARPYASPLFFVASEGALNLYDISTDQFLFGLEYPGSGKYTPRRNLPRELQGDANYRFCPTKMITPGPRGEGYAQINEMMYRFVAKIPSLLSEIAMHKPGPGQSSAAMVRSVVELNLRDLGFAHDSHVLQALTTAPKPLQWKR